MPLICCCLERLVNPSTNVIVAAHGWIQEKKEFPKKYWVRIDPHPVEYFRRPEVAKFFYDHSCMQLRAAIAAHDQKKTQQTPAAGPAQSRS